MTTGQAVRVERWDVFARAPGQGAAGSADLAVEIDQGDAMGRPSRLTARAFAVGDLVRRTEVAGRARLILRETVRLQERAAR